MTVRKLDEFLQLAIQLEINSQKFYQDARNKTGDRKVQIFLHSLVEDEKGHEKILISIREMEIYRLSTPIDEKTATAFQQSDGLLIPELSPAPTLAEIYMIALQHETRTHQLYQQLARITENEDLKELLINLAEEELNHHHQIEQKFKAQNGQFGLEI